MKDSTRAVTIEIDNAIAALDAQMLRSATVIDAVATTIEAAREGGALTRTLRCEAAALRATADRYR